MMDITNKLKLAEKMCQQQGMRLTHKRKQVLSILLPLNKAISAYELIELFKSQHQEELSPMSAYRILDFLIEANLVHKINIANKYIACAHIGTEHSHEFRQFLICQYCQRVDEVPGNKAELAALSLQAKQTGYQLISPQIELNCICDNCK